MKASTSLTSIVGAALALSLSPAMAETKTYDITGFDQLDISTGIYVEARVGKDFSIRAEGSQEAIDRLRIELDDDSLEIGRERGAFFGRKNSKVTVYIEMPSLEEVEVSSGSSLFADGIDASDFEVSVSSGARAELRGHCSDLEADGSSGAKLDADDLRCDSVEADVSSGANLNVYASRNVSADASSGGNITVYGNPTQTNIEKSSGGNVSIRD